MRKPLSFSLVAMIAFFAVIGVMLLFTFVGSSYQNPDLPSIPNNNGGGTDSVDYSRVEINTKNVQDIIAAMKRPAEYYTETKSETFYDKTSAVTLRRRWVRDGISRLDIMSKNGNVTLCAIFTDADVYYWAPGARQALKMSRGNFSASEEQMMMDYTTLLSLPVESIRNAKLSRIGGESCIYVEAVNQYGYVEKYWVSTQHGLLLQGQTLKDDQIIYSIQLIELDLTRPHDIEFTLPDKKLITSSN